MEKTNIDKINKWLSYILATVILIIIPLIPDIPGKERILLKTIILKTTVIVIALSFLCLNAIFSYKKNIKITKYEWILIAYLICVYFSTMMSKYKLADLFFGTNGRGEGLLAIACYIIIFIIIQRNFVYSTKFFEIMTIVIIIVSGWGIIQTIIPEYIVNMPFINISVIRAKMAISNMSNPNFFSSYLLIFLPIYIIKYLEEKDIKLLPVIAIIFTAFVCAKTMGGYLTFIITMIIIITILLIIKHEKKKMLKHLMLLISVLTISFIAINALNDNVYINELKTFNTEIENLKNKDASFGSNRGIAWKIAIKIIKDYPVFGIGIDSFATKTLGNKEYYWDEYSAGGYYFDKAHCEYLQIAATTGIPSLICYITLLLLIALQLIRAFKNNLKQGKDTKVYMLVGSSLFAYLMQAGANISITFIAPAFWIMLGIAANVCNADSQNQKHVCELKIDKKNIDK